MEDDPLPLLLPNDPRNRLSVRARKRINRAHIEAERLRAEAEASIEARGLAAEPERAHYERNQASLAAARVVLQAVRIEFSGLGMPTAEFRDCMLDEVEGAANSLGLYTSQRRLLELEFYYPDGQATIGDVREGLPSDSAIPSLVDHADAIYRAQIEEHKNEEGKRFADVRTLNISALGKAHAREQILAGC